MKTFLIILSTLLVVYISYKTYSIYSLDKGLEAKIKTGAIILDVRTATEFKAGHIEGAINIPLGHLHDPVRLDKTKTYITCCSHGLRSIKAVSLLKEQGFTQVFNGGAWSDLEKTIAQCRK